MARRNGKVSARVQASKRHRINRVWTQEHPASERLVAIARARDADAELVYRKGRERAAYLAK